MNYFDIHKQTAINRYLKAAAHQKFVGLLTEFLETKLELLFIYANTTAETLWVRMTSPNLYYHTPVHILALLRFAQQNDINLNPAEELAIWFHDAIYVTNRTDNEINSAKFMESQLLSSSTQDILQRPDLNNIATVAKKHIHSTADHLLKEKLSYSSYKIMDLDLSAFSLDREQYTLTTSLIRQEYPTISDEVFNQGRKEFLIKLLERGPIYRTDKFKNEFEEKASKNIKLDLENLK
ncbi:MAG: hypothetical protein DWQ19_12735 [Crenarchaeota archaeon]|nr:MAG: hypothetical protein DWQ19_12735 [Thermoproteota archaeon]